MTFELLKIKVLTDGGPWAMHNYPCPVYSDEPAVLEIHDGVFHPSWKAQSEGWALVKTSGWRGWVIKKLLNRGDFA